MSAAWTPEPITVVIKSSGPPWFDASYVVLSEGTLRPITEASLNATAQRLTACYNGCAGLNPAAYRNLCEVIEEGIGELDFAIQPRTEVERMLAKFISLAKTALRATHPTEAT